MKQRHVWIRNHKSMWTQEVLLTQRQIRIMAVSSKDHQLLPAGELERHPTRTARQILSLNRIYRDFPRAIARA